MDHFLARAATVGYTIIEEDYTEIENMSLENILKNDNDKSMDMPNPKGKTLKDSNDF